MPLPDFGLLRGQVINVLPFQQIGDHYNIEVSATGQIYRIAVDVYSTLKGSPKFDPQNSNEVWDEDRLLMFYKNENYSHPLLAALWQTAAGFTARTQLPATLHPDYVHGQPALFPLSQMTVVPPKQADNDGNDLNDDLNPWIQKAMNNPQAEIFVFGDFFNDTGSSSADTHPYFNPDPQMGIHDVHMNQGDSGSEKKDNGPGQDGALFLRFIAAAAPGSPAPARSHARNPARSHVRNPARSHVRNPARSHVRNPADPARSPRCRHLGRHVLPFPKPKHQHRHQRKPSNKLVNYSRNLSYAATLILGIWAPHPGDGSLCPRHCQFASPLM